METTTISVPPQQPIAAMEVGTWVRTKDIDTAAYNNKIGKIKDRFGDDQAWVLFQNQQYDSSERELILKISNLEVLEDQENAQQHQTLEAWQSRYTSAKERLDRMHTQFDYLCEVITETAEDAGYCDEYDKVVDEVNGRMSAKGYSMGLTRREREYDVVVTMTATITVSTTVQVTATNEEEACDYVTDDPETYMDVNDLFMDEIRYNGVDCDDVSADVR